MKNVKNVVRVTSNSDDACPHCHRIVSTDFAETINHYLNEHDYKLLHAGTETEYVDDSKVFHHSVALLGK